MKKIAFLFPGQGSQYAGMGKDLAEKFPPARKVFDQADATLGFPLSRLCFEGPEEELKLTENTQPAILTTSIAAWQVFDSYGYKPSFVAGHSLGEYSAMVACGALSLESAVNLVRCRGRYMQQAVPVGEGAMAAILGLNAETLTEVCAAAAQGQIVAPANFNSAQQIVIAGHKEAVNRAIVMAKEKGAKRGILLPVSAPFHSPLMLPAQERLAEDLRKIAFAAPACPVVNNVEAKPVVDPMELRDGLIHQVSHPVRWQQTMDYLLSQDVKILIEIGPGKVLTGLLKKSTECLLLINIEDSAGIESAVKELEANIE